MNDLLPLLDQLHPLSLAVGLGAGVLTLVLPLLILLGRGQRHRLVLALRLEQAEKEVGQFGEELEQVRQERNQLARECREIDIENASLQTACNVMRQQVEERETLLARTRRQIEQDFRLLAGEIMNDKETTLNRRHESTLNALLRPFHDQLTEFKRRLEDVQNREARDRVTMLRTQPTGEQRGRQPGRGPARQEQTAGTVGRDGAHPAARGLGAAQRQGIRGAGTPQG